MGFLKGKVAIVTGASRGIGRAIVKELAKEGCHIVFNYLKSEQEAQRLQKEVEQIGSSCRSCQVDIKDYPQVKSFVDETLEHFGKIDILINNAGIIIDKALMLMSPEDWAQVIATNLTGTFNATRACIVPFMKQRKGDIIHISSVSGLTGLPGQTNYSASKGGINAFTKALAKEVASYGIRVNAIAPGYIETEMVLRLPEQQMEQIKQSIPLGRLGKPEEIAYCVKFLLSEAASYITGQIIQVDGGLVIH